MPRKPYKFDAKKKAEYLEKLRAGVRRGKAAEAVGLTRQLISVTVRRDPKFAADVDQAELDACELVEDALFREALKGNVTAIQVYLYNRWPERWKDQRNIGKQDAIELFLATLPPDLGGALRVYLAGPKPQGGGPVRPDQSGGAV